MVERRVRGRFLELRELEPGLLGVRLLEPGQLGKRVLEPGELVLGLVECCQLGSCFLGCSELERGELVSGFLGPVGGTKGRSATEANPLEDGGSPFRGNLQTGSGRPSNGGRCPFLEVVPCSYGSAAPCVRVERSVLRRMASPGVK